MKDDDGDNDLLVFFRNTDTDIDCETLFAYISGVTVTGDEYRRNERDSDRGIH